MTSRAPWRRSRLAAGAERWPELQITATGRSGSMLVGHAVDVVVGHVDRAGDVAGVPLVPLAHVEDLQLVARARAAPATVMRSIRSTGRRSSRQLVMPPARKPAEPRDADRLGERGGVARVLVVAPDEDHALARLDQPGELRAEARRAAP